MPRHGMGIDVLTAARHRIKVAFDNFEKFCVSFSGGKDSTVMLHLVMNEAIKRNQRVAVLVIDLEGQYKLTIDCIEKCFEMYSDYIDPFWICLPIHLRNAVSVYEPFWITWDKKAEDAWIRQPPPIAMTDSGVFPFFRDGMEFEEFVPEFAEWYSDGKPSAFFVGIRTVESFNRHLAIASRHKTMFDYHRYTTGVCKGSNSFNFYPIYDWATKDIWIFHAKNPKLPYNKLYDYMHKAGLPLSQMRICQPYGDDQRRGLWLFHLVEPETWGRIVARVNGANSGSMYAKEHGNINGYRKVSCPSHLTWKEFARTLVSSMPEISRKHYETKIGLFASWWMDRGYPEGIPDKADYKLEILKKVPSWRRVCKTLLRNDYWCKGIGFQQQKSAGYEKYLALMERKKEEALDMQRRLV